MRSVRRAATTTFAPAPASARAKPAPRPEDAPVTIAVLPVRSNRSDDGLIGSSSWTASPGRSHPSPCAYQRRFAT